MDLSIRNENDSDFRLVEEVTREAFWNLYVPGCDEHYLVNVMRNHPDFIPELDFIILRENRIIGNIMYTKSQVIDSNNSHNKLSTITFGPVSVLPDFQKQGVGSALIRYSLQKAAEFGYKTVIIEGHPHNYCRYGFRCAKDMGVSDSKGHFPYSLLVLELEKGYLANKRWRYIPSGAYEINSGKAEEFDKMFTPKKKDYRYTQEEFSIASRANLPDE